MATKKELIQKFQKEQPDYWKVELFERLGFVRKQCSCGKFFWTLEEDRSKCPDPPCQSYEFLDNPPTKKRFDYIQSWKKIEKFFVKNGHTSVRRYPVVCRWRPDLFFTVASIIDFQRVDNGIVSFEFPANPLIVPQMCLRFLDIPNIGVSGRHFSAFVMIGQHALFDNKNGYWKDKCIDLDFELLTKIFGIPKHEIVFVEDAWIGYGAFGLSLEYFVRGLELGNAVFTEFLGGLSNYRVMEKKVIDMGAGLERFNWITQGTATAYDCVFGPVIEKLKKNVDYDKNFFLKYAKLAGSLNLDEVPNIKVARERVAKQLKVSVDELEKKVSPLEACYAIADHAKALAFAIADGGLPSNVAGGYNLRVILRRALSFIDKFKLNLKLQDVAMWHIDYLKKMFPELEEHRDEIVKILDVEEKRYEKTKIRISRIIETFGGKKPNEEELIKLYDSEGITPEQLGIEAPSDFYTRVTERHMKAKPVVKGLLIDVSGLPKTKILYYDDLYEFKAKVLKIFGSYVVLDKTAFYPKHGGQDSDTGTIGDCNVISVERIGPVIVHKLEFIERIKEGETVVCSVDKERREILTKHHDAIHIISGAAKQILGNHVHQYGSEKTVDKARIDLTHYESLSEKEVEAIESLANKIVEKNLPIKKFVMKRNEAEQKYGFDIYAGGYVPAKEIRIVEIPGHDIEACGGTHSSSTGEVGYITIIRTKRIADGLVRIEIKAGDVALKYLKWKEKILKDVAKMLNVEENDVPKAVKSLFERWKKKRKELRRRK